MCVGTEVIGVNKYGLMVCELILKEVVLNNILAEYLGYRKGNVRVVYG